MEQIESSSKIIKEKLRVNFDGKIVRKDLTKKIKEGANVPVYVLEFLLGQYCSSDDPEIVVFLQIILYVRTRHRRYYLCFVRKAVIQLSI